MPGLFDLDGDNLHIGYRNIRAANSETEASIKAFAEGLWAQYEPYADADFLNKFALYVEPQYWEMYLTCTLIDMGFDVSSNDAGPDVCIDHEGQKIWIEAITPTPGSDESADQVPDIVPINLGGRLQPVPVRQIMLRYTHALLEKKNKFNEYLKSDIVSSQDVCIVAISGAQIHPSNGGNGLPYIVRSVYPFGDQYVALALDSFDVVETGHRYQESIPKASGVEIPKTAFISDEYSNIDGIFFNPRGIGNTSTTLGADFVSIHNFKATIGIPDGVIHRGKEYFVSEEEEGWFLHVIDWESNSAGDNKN